MSAFSQEQLFERAAMDNRIWPESNRQILAKELMELDIYASS